MKPGMIHIVTNMGKEMGVNELNKCKRIVYFENDNNPHFSIRQGRFQSPGSPMASPDKLVVVVLVC